MGQHEQSDDVRRIVESIARNSRDLLAMEETFLSLMDDDKLLKELRVRIASVVVNLSNGSDHLKLRARDCCEI